MANAIKKTADENGIYHYAESIHTPDYTSADWYLNPDISGVTGIDRNYWKPTAGSPAVVVEMSQGEKDAIDAALSPDDKPDDGVVIRFQETFLGEELKVYTLPVAMPRVVVHVIDPYKPELVNAQLVSPKGTGWDPGNISTGEANINNGVFGDLCYNNSSVGNTPGIIYGIDMGSPTTVTAMKRYDYNVSYYDTEWEFVGMNTAPIPVSGRFPNGDPLEWEVIFTATQSAYAGQDDPYFKTFLPKAYRYYGVRCISSANASYSIVSELELYQGTLVTVEKELTPDVDYKYFILSPTIIVVQNMSSETKTLKTVIVGA